jgi:hypothetical protein
MREVSEDEVMEMVGESDYPVLSKEESEEMKLLFVSSSFRKDTFLGSATSLKI